LSRRIGRAGGSASELPRGYCGNPATSPLAGFTSLALPPARPILRLN